LAEAGESVITVDRSSRSGQPPNDRSGSSSARAAPAPQGSGQQRGEQPLKKFKDEQDECAEQPLHPGPVRDDVRESTD
jgi:hypothetical protein